VFLWRPALKASVDSELCVGCGTCEEICPAVFQLVDGKSRVKLDMVPAREEAACKSAEKNCPTSAISVE